MAKIKFLDCSEEKIQTKWDKFLEWLFECPKGSIGKYPELPGKTEIKIKTNFVHKDGKSIFIGDIVTEKDKRAN